MRFKFLFVLILSMRVFAQAPDFELRDLSGHFQTLQSVRGDRFTVIDFWATWCAPCVRSLPELNALSREYAESGIRFVGINEDGPRNLGRVGPFVQSMQVVYPVLVDLNQETASRYQVNALPMLFILDSADRIVWSHSGFLPGDEQILKSMLDTLLAGEETP